MKTFTKVLMASLVILLAVTPVSAAQWYISGLVDYNAPTTVCNRAEGDICTTAVDALLGEGWAAEDGSTRNVIANTATHRWVLMQIEYSDYQALVGNQFVDLLPDFPFDAKMTAMTPSTRNNLDAILTKWSISVNCTQNADGYRDVIRCIGRQIDPNWVETTWGN